MTILDHSEACWMFFLTIFALQNMSNGSNPCCRQGPPIGCWSGLRCAAPPTSAAPKWARPAARRSRMVAESMWSYPKLLGFLLVVSSSGLFLSKYLRLLEWFSTVDTDWFFGGFTLSSWGSSDRGKHRWSKGIGDQRTCTPQWSAQCPEVSEGSLVEVQEMNNVEIQGGWSAPQPVELERGGKIASYWRYLLKSPMPMRLDLMHRRNPGSGSELAQKVAK